MLPTYGTLAPGDSRKILFKFYGHFDISADVIAACKVEGGPTYELMLKGEASSIHYQFNTKTLDLGPVLYSQVHTTELILTNRGRVKFQFCTVGLKNDPSDIAHGEIAVSPAAGMIPASQSVTFTVSFLPGVPERFVKSFELQVAHFPVEVITVVGEAVYPKVLLPDLPRVLSSVSAEMQEEARENLEVLSASSVALPDYSREDLVYSKQQLLETEMDRLLVKESAASNANRLFVGQPKSRPRCVVSIVNACLMRACTCM